MSSPRGIGQILEGQAKGLCKPEDAQINFAVPARQNLCDEKPGILPGVMLDLIKTLSEHMKDKMVKIGVDAKKL